MSRVGDLLLGLVKDDAHFGSFNIDNAAGIALVLALNHTYLITGLEILADTADIHLQLLTQFDVLIIHRLESDLPFIHRYNSSLNTTQVTPSHTNLIPLSILGSPSRPQRLNNHPMSPLRIRRLLLLIIIPLLRLLDRA